MKLHSDLHIIGTLIFNGEVQDASTIDDALEAVIDSIFAELSKHLDCSRLVVHGRTWAEYQLRREVQRAEVV